MLSKNWLHDFVNFMTWKRHKTNRFYNQNNNFARASGSFVRFFTRFCTTTTWKCLISRFMEYVNKQRRSFSYFSELGNENSKNAIGLRWCYTGWFATMICSATALQCWNNVVTIWNNVATMLQRFVELKIDVVNRLV